MDSDSGSSWLATAKEKAARSGRRWQSRGSSGGQEVEASVDAAEVRLTEEQRTRWIRQLEGAVDDFAMETLLSTLAEAVEEFHIWELACSLNSALTSACLRLKLKAFRKTLEEGYDLEHDETANTLIREYDKYKPLKLWFSLRCTEWCNIQNLNQRTTLQVESLRKKRQRGKKQIKTAKKVILHALELVHM